MLGSPLRSYERGVGEKMANVIGCSAAAPAQPSGSSRSGAAGALTARELEVTVGGAAIERRGRATDSTGDKPARAVHEVEGEPRVGRGACAHEAARLAAFLEHAAELLTVASGGEHAPRRVHTRAKTRLRGTRQR